MYLKDAMTEYSFDCRIRKLSPKTIDNYMKQLRYFQTYLEEVHGITHVEEIRRTHIKHFLSMMDEKKRKPQYINDLLKVFKTFFRYAVKEEHILINPTDGIRNVKQPKVKIITFTELEIRRLLNYYHGRDYLNTRNRTMLALFFDTGMRLNEVITLCADQIHEDHILVHGKGNKERLVPVSPYLAKALMQYKAVRGGYFEGKLAEKYFFLSYRGRKMTQESITKFFREAAVEVGVNPQVRVSPHTCRHTLLSTFKDSSDDFISLLYYLIPATGFQCHWPEISLAWLMSKDGYYTDLAANKINRPESWRKVMICCPVDVIVYDENGNEFASIRGENITNSSDVHGVSITATGTKQVILPSDEGYSIKIIATDAGEMDYSVLEYNVRDGKYNLVQNYQNLPLTTGESYYGDIPAFHTDDYYDEESDGSTTKYTLRGPNGNELQPDMVLRGDNVYEATVSLSTNNNKGIVTGGGSFVATEYAQVEAICMPTVEFLGWYRNGQLVSTEETYRFEVLEDIELVAHFSEGDYHTLHVISTEGGVVPEGSCEVPATVQIQIEAQASDGYEFVRWEATAGSFDNPQKIDALFTMPSEDVTVMAVFQPIKSTLPPKTGDDTPLGLYMVLLGLSACVVIASASKRKTRFGK